MKVGTTSLLLILLNLGPVNCLSGEYINNVPAAVKGRWIQHLSEDDISLGCKPAQLVISDHALIEYGMDCGEGIGGPSKFMISKIVKESAWFSDKVTYGLIGSFSGVGAIFSWVIEPRNTSESIYVYMTDPNETGRREVGVFSRR